MEPLQNGILPSTLFSAVVLNDYIALSRRNKENLKNALSASLRVTLKNHLGTTALASVLDVIMLSPRIVLTCLAQVAVLSDMLDCWMRYMDGFFSSHLYIMTGKYPGYPTRS